MPIDRSRRFDLPGIQDLNKDQDAALALPVEGQHLIVGGPGVGKSVVALLRARRLARHQENYQILVYNRLLDHSNRHLFGPDQALKADTWHTWFFEVYRSSVSAVVPTEKNEGFKNIDWNAANQEIQSLDEDKIKQRGAEFLIIDEGQDMPPAFYEALTNLGFENFYVAADQNQQIYPEQCSSRQDIENSLAIEPGETLELKTNYRNTRPIARLARHFYPSDPASPRPDLPEGAPAAATPELWTYGTANTKMLATIADDILRLGDRDPRRLIGIITPNNKAREKFIDALNRANPELDNGKPPVSTFAARQQADLPDFGQGGLMVINAQSCKGLEFDIVILADIDQHWPKDPHTLKARFYVMVARAREQVILLRTGAACPIVDELLPDGPMILIRR